MSCTPARITSLKAQPVGVIQPPTRLAWYWVSRGCRRGSQVDEQRGVVDDLSAVHGEAGHEEASRGAGSCPEALVEPRLNALVQAIFARYRAGTRALHHRLRFKLATQQTRPAESAYLS